MSDYIEQEIYTPFGELTVMVSKDSKDTYSAAIEELNDSIRAAKIQETYLDKLNRIYAIEVSFHYGKAYKEFSAPIKDENHALDTAISQLLYDVATY